MIEAQKAAFKLEKFKIPNFSYTESNSPDISIIFTPSGKYFQNKGVFELKLDFLGVEAANKDKATITVSCIAYFKFEEPIAFSDIPKYFYINSIAIVFPYLRSFVSTLTLQANTGLMILGLFNLSNLEDELKGNTECIIE